MSNTTNGKRAAPDDGILTGREKRMAKNRSARRIDTHQGTLIKAPSGDFPQISDPLSGHQLAEARLHEINGLQSSIRNAGFAMNSLAFQSLPHSLRRRAASHNVQRLPMRLRGRARQEMAQAPPIKRKLRKRIPPRRKGTIREEYVRRQSDKKWLETHVWHAKRMKMIDIWGYRLALHTNHKSGRTNYRAFSHLCLLHDASYFHCLELAGTFHDIVTIMNKLSDPSLPSVGSARYNKGSRMGHTTLYDYQQYPTTLLCPVTFLWRPDSSDATDFTAGNRQRALWIWVHPAAYDDTRRALKSAMLDTKMQDDLQLVNRGDELQRFELSGPRSTALLQAVLDPAEGNNQADVWRDLRHLRTSSSLPPGVVLGLAVQDPRLRFPQTAPRRTNQISPEDDARISALLKEWPQHAAHSDLWEEEVRARVRTEKISDHALNQRREQIPQHATLPLTPADAVIPVLLIQRGDFTFSGPCTTGRPLSKTEWMEGWSLIVPKGWGTSFWKSLVFAGAYTGGLKDIRELQFESGMASFPYDFPGSHSFEQVRDMFRMEAECMWKRKPPAKRINYRKMGVEHPFEPAFESLTQTAEEDKEDKENARNYWLLQGDRLISAILTAPSDEGAEEKIGSSVPALLASRGATASAPYPLGAALLKVRLTFTGRSKPVPNATIHMMEDLTTYEEYTLPKNRDGAHDTKKTHALVHIGYLTNGGFSLSTGCGFGIGACTALGLRKVHELDQSQTRKEKRMVLVQNPDSTIFRPARLEILG